MPTRRKWAWIASGQDASVVFGLCNEALGAVSLRLSQRRQTKPSCRRSGSILTFAAGGIACGSPADDSGIVRMDHATLTVPQALSFAFSAYSAGKLGEAEQLCQQILASDSNHFAALHLLAII